MIRSSDAGNGHTKIGDQDEAKLGAERSELDTIIVGGVLLLSSSVKIENGVLIHQVALHAHQPGHARHTQHADTACRNIGRWRNMLLRFCAGAGNQTIRCEPNNPTQPTKHCCCTEIRSDETRPDPASERHHTTHTLDAHVTCRMVHASRKIQRFDTYITLRARRNLAPRHSSHHHGTLQWKLPWLVTTTRPTP